MANTGTPSNSINSATYTSGSEILAADHSVPHADLKTKYGAHTHTIGSMWQSIHSSQDWVMVSGTNTGTSGATGIIVETITFATDADQGDPSFLTGGAGIASIQVMVNVRVPSSGTIYFIGNSFTVDTLTATVLGQLVYSNAGTIETKASAVAYEIDWVVVGRRT